jgi:hypothetical protein
MEEFRNMLVGSVHEALDVFDFPIWVFVDPLVDMCVERILDKFNSRERIFKGEVFKIMRREIIDELQKGNFFEVGEEGNGGEEGDVGEMSRVDDWLRDAEMGWGEGEGEGRRGR